MGVRRASHVSLWVGSALLLAACSRGPAPAAPTLVDLEAITVPGVFDTTITLSDGVYEGPPVAEDAAERPRLELARETYVSKDLDGDGVDEAAAILVERSGGSGTFYHLVVAARRDGAVRTVATDPLGDRVMIRSLAATDSGIVMELVEHGPDDPACCPTLRARKAFRLEGDRLTSTRVVLGKLRLADLEGTAWRLVEFSPGVSVHEDVEVTASFEGGRVAGKSGCNRYSGPVRAVGDSAIAIGPTISTKMACEGPAMAVETRYLEALERVNQFSFVLGRLALMHLEGDTPGTLLFEETTGAALSPGASR